MVACGWRMCGCVCRVVHWTARCNGLTVSAPLGDVGRRASAVKLYGDARWRKKNILEIENETSKDYAKKHFKRYYLKLSELEKKLTQIKAEMSSIKEIKEQWDKEAEAE